jgi:hypothetical protein
MMLLLALSCLGLRAAGAVTLDSSVAVTDPATLQALERGGLSISRLLGPALGLTREVDNRGLFSVPALTTVRDTVKLEIADKPKTSPDPYVAAMAKSKDTSQKFNPKYIDDDGSTLDLTGVVGLASVFLLGAGALAVRAFRTLLETRGALLHGMAGLGLGLALVPRRGLL